MSNTKAGSLGVLAKTYLNCDWRLIVALSGVFVVIMGLVPLFNPDAFYSLRFKVIRDIFIYRWAMISMYLIIGFSMVFSLRKRLLAFVLPIGICLSIFFCYTQISLGGQFIYSALTSGFLVVLLTDCYIRGGGFSINSSIEEIGVTPQEVALLQLAGRLKTADAAHHEATAPDK